MALQVHRLFFALRPDAALLLEIGRAAEAVKAGGRVRGRWLKPARLHLTLQFLGDFIEAREVIERARYAGASLRFAPFEFTLDHVQTFPRRFNPPCVLCCTAQSEHALRSLHAGLGNALREVGLGEHLAERPYTPHLTIAYADQVIAAPIAIAPIVWKVDAFALVDSAPGQSTQAEIERWPLRA